MSHESPVHFNRPPRLQLPSLPQDEIDLPPPPEQSPPPDQNWFVSIIPVLGISAMAFFYIFRAMTDETTSALFAIPLLLLAMFAIGGTVLAQRWRRRDHEKSHIENTLNYIRLLEKKRARLQAAHDAQMAILQTRFPDPEDALHRSLTQHTSLWERRPNDPDFATLRLGLGRVSLSIKINTPDPDVDSSLLDRAFALADSYRFLHQAPVTISLERDSSVGVCGPRSHILETTRAAITQLATTHAPQDLHIHLIASRAHRDDWRWLEWMPHTSQSHKGGEADFTAYTSDQIRNLMGHLSQLLDARKEQRQPATLPHLLVIIDDPQLAEGEPVYSTLLRDGGRLGASTITLAADFNALPADCQAVVEINDTGRFRLTQIGPQPADIAGSSADRLSLVDAEHIARALAAVNLRKTGGGGRIPRQVDFLDLYNAQQIEDLTAQIAERWARPIPQGVLPHPIPIGRESLAVITELLLDEDHHGPHGVLAGTTGSGKSELLQTMICALAVEHDPRLVNFLLIDFKGGSTFNLFADLPHTVGTITNLDGTLVARALEALKSETEYRQQFLKKMNVRDITQYHRYFARTATHINDPSYVPLPHLFIIVDEFAQLAKEMPDFLRELVRTAQVGRSLGLHLILGTQSPMDVITEEMNANLQFRICLRVQNIEASRSMLRRPDAAYLPPGWPGRGYFQVGERGEFKQFQTAYVGSDYTSDASSSEDNLVFELITASGEVINLLDLDEPGSNLLDEPYTLARAIVETISNYATEHNIPSMPPILLPPLEDRITLQPAFQQADLGGWNGRDWTPPGFIQEGIPIALGSAPVGLIDDIYTRAQYPLWIHLNTGVHDQTGGKDGHVLILGGPGTGKTTFCRTLALSQALLHPPERLHMYFLSFTGGGLNDMGHLPHTEEVVHGTESERVRRLFGRLIHTLDRRQSGQTITYEPTIVLFIDQYEQFRDSYYNQHMPDFERLINEGRAFGIYLIMTASSLTTVPDRLRSLVQQRIALQLGDPSDYTLAVGPMPRRADRTLPNGRGFITHNPPLTCQISLPTIDSIPDNDESTRSATNQIITAMTERYLTSRGLDPRTATADQSQSPPPLRELPARIPLDGLPMPETSADGSIITTLGRCDDDALNHYTLDWFEDGPHFVVTGPAASGKTNLLTAAVLAAAQQHSPQQVRFLLVDFTGRSLRQLEGLKHTIQRVTDTVDLQAQLRNLENELHTFQSEGIPPDGPRTVIVIDDYDIASEALGPNSDLLRQLRDHVRLHSELGLHLWVGGYLERLSDPLIKQLLLRRSGFALSHRDSLHNLNIRISGLSQDAMPPGRAYVAQHGTVSVVQMAIVENPALYINRINSQIWREAPWAAWRHPANQTPPPTEPESTSTTSDVTGIDTDGLLQDLLGGSIDD